MGEVSEWRRQHARQRGQGRLEVGTEIGEVVVCGKRSEGGGVRLGAKEKVEGEELGGGGKVERGVLEFDGETGEVVRVELRVRMGLVG